MVLPLLLLVYLLPLSPLLFLCMRPRPPRVKTPSKKKKGPPSSSGAPSLTGKQPLKKGEKSGGNTIGVTGTDGKSTMTAPIPVSGYLPSPEEKGASAPQEERAPFIRSTSLPETKPVAIPPPVATPARARPARSRTSRDKKRSKSIADKGGGGGGMAERTCEEQSLEEMTCDGKTRGSIRSIRSRVERVEYQNYTAITRE
ncbi:hypothetical protein PMAYCL1PPCAC_07323, partial [Pristionchus mayeri]